MAPSDPEAPATHRTHWKWPSGPGLALTPVLRRFRGWRIVLASASPRRRDILGYTGLLFDVMPSRFAETLDKAAFPTPHAYAKDTAQEKALEVARVPVADGLILEKPQDKEDAFRMLRRRWVAFSALLDKLLRDYVDSEEPIAPPSPPRSPSDRKDKAGRYALQALGAMLVARTKGDFLGAVGFLLNCFCRELQALLGSEATPAGGGADGPCPPPRAENTGIGL